MMTKQANKYEEKFIKALKKQKDVGKYKKSVFHIHTPASYDYKIYNKYSYSEASTNVCESELIDSIKSKKVFPINYDFNAMLVDNIFENKKEFYIYLLMAIILYEKEIELVVISDHNTIEGYSKLKLCLKYVYDLHKSHKYCELFPGVEISCADKNHIVGIFSPKTNLNIVQNMLDNILLSKKDGSFQTSSYVIDEIAKIGGIPYIAHINTSGIFKDEFLTKAYKKNLFLNNNLKVLGVKDAAHIDNIVNMTKNIIKSSKEFCFFIDEDSHSLDDLGTSFFWIKGTKVMFDMILNAIRDYTISIEVDEPKKPEIFIKGFMASPWNNKNGFFCEKDKNDDSMTLLFSDSLTCLIGGRGTGKSTVLKLIDFVLTQKCRNQEELSFFCKNQFVFIMISYRNQDYLIEFSAPKIDDEDAILSYFDDSNGYDFYHTKRIKYDSVNIAEYTLRHYIDIYTVKEKNKKFILLKEKNKRHFFDLLLDQQYSINELVEKSKGKEIDYYISNKILKNRKLSSSVLVDFRCRNLNGLVKRMKEYNENIEKRKLEVNDILKDFNKKNSKLLYLEYNYNEQDEIQINLEDTFGFDENIEEAYFNRMNIKNKNVVEYLYFMLDKLGFSHLLLSIIEKKYDYFILSDLIDFCEEAKQENATKYDYKIDNESNKIKFIDELIKMIDKKETINKINEFFSHSIKQKESFDLKFNVNSSESSESKKELYRSIKNLSLGQKVVALFDFIIGFGEYTNDARPLLIDQPEDNLDNRYIYRNLVKQLRKIKSKRQVVIATHNSTIVTNAKAESVIVLESDNERAWKVASGFPYERKMIKHIINYLEGGEESFKHKEFVYGPVIIDK